MYTRSPNPTVEVGESGLLTPVSRPEYSESGLLTRICVDNILNIVDTRIFLSTFYSPPSSVANGNVIEDFPMLQDMESNDY